MESGLIVLSLDNSTLGGTRSRVSNQNVDVRKHVPPETVSQVYRNDALQLFLEPVRHHLDFFVDGGPWVCTALFDD
jgi:hypothetical protein